jgi:SAM-dependent methyltransferase
MTTHPTPRAWDTAWEGTPSWETGRPQPVVERLVAEGAFPAGTRILDAGCGSGRHAVLLARAGCRVTGVDVAAAAIARADGLAHAEGVTDRTRFLAADLRTLSVDGAPFDAVLDVGLFHVLQPAETEDYARTLAGVTRAGGRAYVVAWSDRNPFGIGPGRITRRSLRAAFRASAGWRVESIEAAALETRLPPGRVHAWLARITRR